MKKLVSVVTPCYNGERYLERYFNSILSQTYRPLQLIFVNDGSTDKTDEKIKPYVERLEKDNIEFCYIKKENQGLGSAINDGIKLIKGEYLIWPDVDDFLFPKSIEKRVEFLENNPEYGFVCSDGKSFLEGTLEEKGFIKAIVPKNGNMFFNLVSGNVVYTPCGYMIKRSAFDDVNPKREIYPSRYGQDIQMLLPVSYKYKCARLPEILYGRVISDNSLSKRVWKEDNEAWKKRILGLEEIYVETLKSIGGEALAYIPYIYFRDLRVLSAVSKNVNSSVRKEQLKILKKSAKLLRKELIKTIVKK